MALRSIPHFPPRHHRQTPPGLLVQGEESVLEVLRRVSREAAYEEPVDGVGDFCAMGSDPEEVAGSAGLDEGTCRDRAGKILGVGEGDTAVGAGRGDERWQSDGALRLLSVPAQCSSRLTYVVEESPA